MDAIARPRASTPDEMGRVKNGRLAGFIYALDNVGGFGGVADRLNAYNTYLGDPGRITGDIARYQDVTRPTRSASPRGLALFAGESVAGSTSR